MAANVGSDFSVSAGGSVTIPGATHGLGTAALLVQAWDAQTPRRRLQPGRVTIDPTSFDVVCTFAQAQSGRIVLAGAQPATATSGHVRALFASATTWTMPASVHGFATTDLLVAFTDAQAVPHVLTPGSVTIDPVTFEVVATFAQPQSGAAVVIGAGGASAVPHVTQAFSATTSVTLDGAAAGLDTTHLLLQVWDAQSPRQQLQPGSVTIDPSTDLITVTFLQPQSGTVVASGVAGAPTALVGIDFDVGAGGTVTIPGATHGLETAALLVQVWDAQTPRRRIQPGRLTVHPTTFAVEASFMQAQGGRVVLAAAQPATPQHGHYREGFAPATTWTIPASAHGFTTADLLVSFTDAQAISQTIQPGSVTLHPSTYELIATFGQPQAGSVVIVGAAARSVRPLVSQAFSAATSVTFDGDDVGLATTHLLLQVWDTQTPRQQVQPGRLTVDPSSHVVTVSFLQPQSGTLVATGVARVGVWLAAPLGSSTTSTIVAQMGGLVTLIAQPAGASTTPLVVQTVQRQLSGAVQGASTTPPAAIQIAGTMVLVAHPQGASTTPLAAKTVQRLLLAHAQGSSTTPTAIGALLRPLTAQPQGASTTPASTSTLLRSLTGAVLGSSVTPASSIELPGQMTLVALVLGTSVTPSVVRLTLRQLVAAPLGASVTPATVLTTLRRLSAHAQGASTTLASGALLGRQLVAVPLGSSTTPVASATLVRTFTAQPQASSTTLAVVQLLTRRLVATVPGSSTTSATTSTLARGILAHPQGASTTPVANGLMGELRLNVAHALGFSITPVARTTSVRLLQVHPQGATTTPAAFARMGMVLLAQVQGASTTPAAVDLLTRRVVSQVQGSSLTPPAQATTTRPFLAAVVGTSTTPAAVRPSVLRSIVGAVAGTSTTPLTGSRVIRPLQAGLLAVSVTPVAAYINSNLNSFVAHAQGSSTTPSILRQLARGLSSQVLGASSTLLSRPTTVRLFAVHPQASSTTSEPHGRIIRPLVSTVTGESLTAASGQVMARALLAHAMGTSQTAPLAVFSTRLLLASVSGVSVGLPGLLIPFSGQFQLIARIDGPSSTPGIGAMLLNMPRVIQVPARPRVARVAPEAAQPRASLVLTS